MSSSNENIYNETFESVICRVKKLLNIEKDIELARALHTTSSSISTWRTRNTIPFAKLVSFAVRNDVSLDTLLTGRGGTEVDDPKTAAGDRSSVLEKESKVLKSADVGAFGAKTMPAQEECPPASAAFATHESSAPPGWVEEESMPYDPDLHERLGDKELAVPDYRGGGQLDVELLTTITCAVEKSVDETGKSLTPEKRSHLIAGLYDLYLESAKPVDQAKVLHLVKAAA